LKRKDGAEEAALFAIEIRLRAERKIGAMTVKLPVSPGKKMTCKPGAVATPGGAR
jgi:hypothetical protein